MNTFLLLLLLVACCSCVLAQSVQGTFGTAIQLNANADTQINFLLGLGPRLNIRVDSACQITVTQTTSFNALPNNNFQTLSIGTEVGYEIKRTQGTCQILSASLQTSPLALTLITQITAALTAGGNVGCLQYDASANVFSRVAVQQVGSGFAQGLTITVPRFGQYIFVTYSQNIPLPSVYADVQLVGGAQGGGGSGGSGETILSFSGGLLLKYKSSTQASLTTNSYSSLQQTDCSCSNPNSQSYRAYEQWFDFDAQGANSFTADINYTYSVQKANQVGITDETKLRLGYYDETNGQWTFPSNQRVDTSAKVITCTTTRFSSWGVYGEGSFSSSSSASTKSATWLTIVVVVLLAITVIEIVLFM